MVSAKGEHRLGRPSTSTASTRVFEPDPDARLAAGRRQHVDEVGAVDGVKRPVGAGERHGEDLLPRGGNRGGAPR
jgi:hypothetical protein